MLGRCCHSVRERKWQLSTHTADISQRTLYGSAMAQTFTNKKKRSTRSHMNDPFARSDTVAARRVLRDCHIAVKQHVSSVGGAEKRIAWVTVVVLLRTVGHVLDKVDGARSTFLRAAIDERWGEIHEGGIEHEIFHDFIERERNGILKEYRIHETLVEPIKTNPGHADSLLVGSRLLPTNKALQEALNWWETVLRGVEERAHQQLVESRINKRTRKTYKARGRQ